jgi:hypothetical protein
MPLYSKQIRISEGYYYFIWMHRFLFRKENTISHYLHFTAISFVKQILKKILAVSDVRYRSTHIYFRISYDHGGLLKSGCRMSRRKLNSSHFEYCHGEIYSSVLGAPCSASGSPWLAFQTFSSNNRNLLRYASACS